ncbi:MAG: transglycosylase domain-containing protein [Actinomycetota bacterium]
MAQQLWEPDERHLPPRPALVPSPTADRAVGPTGGMRWLPADARRPSSALGILVIVLLAAAVLALALVPAFLTVGASADAIDKRLFSKIDTPLKLPRMEQRSTIYAGDGSVLQRVSLNYNRRVVPLHAIAKIARRAVLAVEDSGFYKHGAIDPSAILRAAVTNAISGHIVEGGSTIAQQLVKDTVVGDERTFSRKLHEAADAIRLENTYTKKQILSMYLNEIYLGNGTYGVAAAGEFYFGEHPGDLSLTQGALLAGMIKAPEFYDPLAFPHRATHRRNHVLDRMRTLGWITAKQYKHARHAPLGLSNRMRHDVKSGPTSYWTQYVINEFLQNPAFGKTTHQRARLLFQGGVRVYTSIEPTLQRQAEAIIERRMSGAGMPQSSLVSIDPKTGQIEAMAVGNQPWGTNNQYNLAVDPGGGRTAGSSFKMYTLVAALEEGISPNTVYNGDSPKTIPNCGGGETWTLHNAEPGGGSFPLWLATADSVNTVFAQVINQVGPEKVAEVAHRMGITNELVPVCPLTLGTSPVTPLQMASGYATLANRGIHCQPVAITRVVNANGKTIFDAKPQCERAIPQTIADEATAMLENVIKIGTGTAANIGRPAAGKTGTGQEFQDAWFVGYTPELATAVWVGYARAEIPMHYVPGYGEGFGGTLAAPIWHDFMLYALRDLPPLGFPSAPIPFGYGYGSSPSSSSTTTTTAPTTTAPAPLPPPPPAGGGGPGNGNGNGNGGPPGH